MYSILFILSFIQFQTKKKKIKKLVDRCQQIGTEIENLRKKCDMRLS